MSDHPATLSKNPVGLVKSESILPHLGCFLLVVFHLLTRTRFLGCTFSLFFVILRTECSLSPPWQNPIAGAPMHTLSWRVHVRACTLGRVQLFGTPRTVAPQAPLSLGFPRQEYWNGLPFPSPGDLPNSGTKPMSPASRALAGGFYQLSHQPESLTVLVPYPRF